MKITFDNDTLLRALKVVSVAASTDVCRGHLNGVTIHVSGTSVKLYATNGHWLAVWTFGAEEAEADAAPEDLKFIVPLAVVKRLLLVLKDAGKTTLDLSGTGTATSMFGDVTALRKVGLEAVHYEKLVAVRGAEHVGVGLFAINAKLMASVMRALALADTTGTPVVVLSPGKGGFDPIMMALEGRKELSVTVMPCRFAGAK